MRVALGSLSATAFLCPSEQQLWGIVDASDPCQNADAAAVANAANALQNLPISSTPLNSPSPILNPSGAVIAAGAATPSTSTSTLLYVGLAAVGAMLLIGMTKR